MSEVSTKVDARPIWVDLASDDTAAAAKFYGELFGWTREGHDRPEYGGYGLFKLGGRDVAGVGPKSMPGQPTAWSIYIGTADSGETAARVTAAGGTVVAPPFDVADQGRMAVFQDPSGAFICTWEPKQMAGATARGEANTLAWAELNARGVEGVKDFYGRVFGWGVKESPMEGGSYIEWQLAGESVAGGMEVPPMVPAEIPSYWLAYFGVNDVDASVKRAEELGGRVLMPGTDFSGGRFAVLADPEGATFGLLSMPDMA